MSALTLLSVIPAFAGMTDAGSCSTTTDVSSRSAAPQSATHAR